LNLLGGWNEVSKLENSADVIGRRNLEPEKLFLHLLLERIGPEGRTVQVSGKHKDSQ
jgi:hypothetical protein